MQKVKAEIIRPATFSVGTRVETGVVEFEYPKNPEDPKDWPGIFIRGDNALMLYAPALEHILSKVSIDPTDVRDTIQLSACKGLVDLLRECEVKHNTDATNSD